MKRLIATVVIGTVLICAAALLPENGFSHLNAFIAGALFFSAAMQLLDLFPPKGEIEHRDLS